jgi:hypothetical protein
MTGRVLLGIGMASLVVGVGLALAAAPALRSRHPITPPVSPIAPRPVLAPWVEGEITVDARSEETWTYFDFSRGSVVTDAQPSGHNWDLAFQRYRVATNSGSTNPRGHAGALKVGQHRPTRAPEKGYRVDEWEQGVTLNRVFHRWYRYSPMVNGLVSRGDHFVIRTADAGYAWLRFVAYYCPAALGGGPGCVSFRYGYRSDFSHKLGRGEA